MNSFQVTKENAPVFLLVKATSGTIALHRKCVEYMKKAPKSPRTVIPAAVSIDDAVSKTVPRKPRSLSAPPNILKEAKVQKAAPAAKPEPIKNRVGRMLGKDVKVIKPAPVKLPVRRARSVDSKGTRNSVKSSTSSSQAQKFVGKGLAVMRPRLRKEPAIPRALDAASSLEDLSEQFQMNFKAVQAVIGQVEKLQSVIQDLSPGSPRHKHWNMASPGYEANVLEPFASGFDLEEELLVLKRSSPEIPSSMHSSPHQDQLDLEDELVVLKSSCPKLSVDPRWPGEEDELPLSICLDSSDGSDSLQKGDKADMYLVKELQKLRENKAPSKLIISRAKTASSDKGERYAKQGHKSSTTPSNGARARSVLCPVPKAPVSEGDP